MKFRNIGIGTRIILMILVMLAGISIVGILGIYSISNIGSELSNIAHEDIPLTESIVEINKHQLEQEVYLHKLYINGMVMGAKAEARKEYEADINALHETEKELRKHLEEVHTIIEKTLAHENDQRVITEYKKIESKMDQIESILKEFEEHEEGMVHDLEAGDISHATKLVHETEEIGHKLEGVLTETMEGIEQFTERSLLAAEQNERQALWLIVSTFAVITLLAVIMGQLFKKSILTSLNRITAITKEVAGASGELSDNSQSQSAAVEEISASLEELIASIQDVAENSSSVSNAAHSSADQAKTGGEAVESSIQAMDKIRESSERITEIIRVITDLAEQTNLLALNAAIEAARAGEHGKGFAVVADEVRKLAERSAKAAQQITQLIEESSARVLEGSKLSTHVGETLESIIEQVQKVAAMVEQISASTEEQAATSNSIKDGMNQISAAVEENAAAAEELSSSSDTVTKEVQTIISGKAQGGTQGKTQRIAQASSPERLPALDTSRGKSENNLGGGSEQFLNW